jgi:UDP-N-acetylglucosamine 2-epimerase (non-hydrolysing)
MINRKIVDHIADVNLPYTEHARRYLLSEGIDGKTIFVTARRCARCFGIIGGKSKAAPSLKGWDLKEGLFSASAHREENVDNERNFLD